MTREFSIDWTQAPEVADGWCMTSEGAAAWMVVDSSGISDLTLRAVATAPSFGFTGKWRRSFTSRPAPTVGAPERLTIARLMPTRFLAYLPRDLLAGDPATTFGLKALALARRADDMLHLLDEPAQRNGEFLVACQITEWWLPA
jgi:hypothetical protein